MEIRKLLSLKNLTIKFLKLMPVSNTGTVKSDTTNTKPTTNTGSSTLAPSNNSSGSSN